MKHERITDLSYKEVIHLESGQRLGYVRDACDTWDPVLWCMIGLSLVMAVVGLFAGRQKNA